MSSTINEKNIIPAKENENNGIIGAKDMKTVILRNMHSAGKIEKEIHFGSYNLRRKRKIIK